MGSFENGSTSEGRPPNPLAAAAYWQSFGRADGVPSPCKKSLVPVPGKKTLVRHTSLVCFLLILIWFSQFQLEIVGF